MWQRVATAVVGIPLLLAVAYLGSWWFFGLALLASVVAVCEFYGFVRALGRKLSLLSLVLGGVSAFLLTYCIALGNLDFSALILLFLLLLVLELFRTKSVLQNGALMMLGIVYTGVFYAFLPLLRNMGLNYIILLLLITWGTDSLAYFWGMRFGKHKMWPAVSPKKSWEGAFGGVLGGVLGGLVSSLFGLISPANGFILGLLGSVMAQVGDLLESAMKRECGIKDSGHLLPGHGGMLDRFDSLLALAPVLYFVLQYVLR